jgi:hypothetical protein
MGEKKGISTIIATVLIVLITVASVTILWLGVYPIIGKVMFTEDINLRLTIDKDATYTVFDKDNGLLSVRVQRGSDDANIVALKFIIDIKGDSQVYKRYNVPGVNEAGVYLFAVGFVDEVSSVKVVPIYLSYGEEIEGSYNSFYEDIYESSGALAASIGKSQSYVSEEYPGLGDGLVFYYSFDEDNVGGVFDYSGNGHTGTVTNAVWTATGKKGGAFEFDGEGDYIDFLLKDTLGTETSGDKTIAFWAKPECKSLGSPPFDNKNSIVFGSEDNYYINFYDICGSGDNLKVFYTDSMSSQRFDFIAIEENVWHYYVLSIGIFGNNVDSVLYIDGSIVDQEGSSGGHGVIDNNFYVGTNSFAGSAEGSNSLQGTLDEFRIYNRVLDEEEVANLYLASGGE